MQLVILSVDSGKTCLFRACNKQPNVPSSESANQPTQLRTILRTLNSIQVQWLIFYFKQEERYSTNNLEDKKPDSKISTHTKENNVPMTATTAAIFSFLHCSCNTLCSHPSCINLYVIILRSSGSVCVLRICK